MVIDDFLSFVWGWERERKREERERKNKGLKGYNTKKYSKIHNTYNTSLAAPGALAKCLQRRTARKANEANLDPPNQKSEITSL